MPQTLSQLIHTIYPSVLTAHLYNGRYHWGLCKLRRLARYGRLRLQTLGAHLEVPRYRLPSLIIPIEELKVPIVWAIHDEMTPGQARLTLAYDLLRNALTAHDRLLLEKIGLGTGIISKVYHYKLTETTLLPDDLSYRCAIYTIGGIVP